MKPQSTRYSFESNISVEPSHISNSAGAALCQHWAYQIIYQKNMEGNYEEKKICLACKEEVKGY